MLFTKLQLSAITIINVIKISIFLTRRVKTAPKVTNFGFEHYKFARSVFACVPMPTHCTSIRFGFHARWIDGVKCGLFTNHAPPGQTTLRVGRVSVDS